ncbi:MAG: Asp23/Gls24 family envelope stress response protein, partial [Bacillota bacterium]
MVQKHCRANNRIRNVISNVRAVRDGGVTISVRLALMPDTDIPELTAELQKTLKEYVEKHSGINVREVGILVEDTSSSPRSRVD